MKKIVLFVVIATIALISCTTAPVDKNAESSKRIIGKEYNVYGGYGYQIIEVDGQEYLSMTGGGICPLVKDTLK